MSLSDGIREVRGLRKQLLPLKARLYILFVVRSPNGISRLVLGNSSMVDMSRKVNVERAILWAGQNAIILAMNRWNMEGFKTGTFLVDVINYGFLYLDRETERGKKSRRVKIKTYTSKGKRRVGVWVKGRKGMKYNFKYKQPKLDIWKSLLEEDFDNIRESKSDIVDRL